MTAVFTWEMRSIVDRSRITYVLVDHVLYAMVNAEGQVYVNDNVYPDVAAAREGATRLTGNNEEVGYVMRGGIWTCNIQVSIPSLKELIRQGAQRTAAEELNKIISAARIMGTQH